MRKNILFADFAKELLTAFVSYKKENTLDETIPASNLFSGRLIKMMKKQMQKFMKWQKEFFTLDGFANYNFDNYDDGGL
jgi:hypothetical protein